MTTHALTPVPPSLDTLLDVIVVGGGVAGLSAALTLGRARRRVLVLDAGRPRNRVAAHMHGVLGHDGRSPGDLVADGRREVEGYGVALRTAEVVRTSRDAAGFTVGTATGESYAARQLVVATGLRDDLPAVPGLREQWGRGVVVCPYCDGYEVGATGRIGILAVNAMSVHQAQLLRQWSSEVTYVADAFGAPEGDDLAALRARGVAIVEGPVERVLTDEQDVLTGVGMKDGRVVALDRLFTYPTVVPLDEPLRQLGAHRVETPMGEFVETDPFGRTSVPGAWAVGNAASAGANVTMSIHQGAFAAAMLNMDLVQADTAAALAAGSPEGVPLG